MLPDAGLLPFSPSGMPRQNIQAAYICFRSRHVVLRFDMPEILSSAMSIFGGMLSSTPIGTPAGTIEIATDAHGLGIEENGLTAEERFDSPAAAVRDMYHRAVKQLIGSSPGLLWIHGGVVAKNGKALLFTAPSGQGKSTLVAYFVAQGWTYLSDELAPIDPSAATVLPFPIVPYMRDSQRNDLALEEVRALDKIQVRLAEDAIGKTALPLSGIYFLSYLPATTDAEITHCPPSLAVVEMLRNSLNPGESRTKEIANLCRLMQQAHAKYLRYSSAAAAATAIARAHLF